MSQQRPDCNVTPETLSAWMDGELSPDRAEEIDRHVSTCPYCADQVERLRAVRDVVQRHPTPSSPDEFVTGVRDRVNHPSGSADKSVGDGTGGYAAAPDRAERETSDPSGRRRFLYSAAALFLIGVIGGIGYLLLPGSGRRKASEADRSAMSENLEKQGADQTAKKVSPNSERDRDAPAARKRGTVNRAASTESNSATPENTGRTASDPSSSSGVEEQPDLNEGGKSDQSELSGKKRKRGSAELTSVPVRLQLQGNRSELRRILRSTLTLLDADRVRVHRPADIAESSSGTRQTDERSLESGAKETQAFDEGATARDDRENDRSSLKIELPYQEARVLIAELVRRDLRPKLSAVNRNRASVTGHASSSETTESSELLHSLKRRNRALQKSWSRASGRSVASSTTDAEKSQSSGGGGAGDDVRKQRAEDAETADPDETLRTVLNRLRSVRSEEGEFKTTETRSGKNRDRRRLLLEWNNLLNESHTSYKKDALTPADRARTAESDEARRSPASASDTRKKSAGSSMSLILYVGAPHESSPAESTSIELSPALQEREADDRSDPDGK